MVTKKTSRKKTAKKKGTRKVAGRRAVQRKMPGWLILFLGIVFGLVIALAGYILGWVPKPDNPNKPIAKVTNKANDAKIKQTTDELTIKPQKEYDFYGDLGSIEVEIDKTQQTSNRKPKNQLLQIGSFKNQQDAESIKARVAFSGLSATIMPVAVNGKQWYRVVIGPYDDSRVMDKDKRKLQNNDFEPIIINQ